MCKSPICILSVLLAHFTVYKKFLEELRTPMDIAYAALGRFDVRFRYLIVVAWVAITIVCVRAFPSLSSATPNTTISAFLPASAPSIQAANLATPFQNTRYASATIVAVHANGS